MVGSERGREGEKGGGISSIVFSRSTLARLASFPKMMRAEGLVGMTIRDCPSSFLCPFLLLISILSVRYDTLGRSEVEDGRVLACGSGRAIDMSYNGLCWEEEGRLTVSIEERRKSTKKG